MIGTGRWFASNRADPRVISLYNRHYSAKPGRSARAQVVGPCDDLTLLTPDCLAMWVWQHNTIERIDHQDGINCAAFRNEGGHLSSDLVAEADELADSVWGRQRHFTYVDPMAVRFLKPAGWCFVQAGWRHVKREDGSYYYSTEGLALLERPA